MKSQEFKTVKPFFPKKSAIDLSHEKKLSFQIGRLVPIYWEDIIPGDSFRVATEVMVRLAPLLAPLMHRLDVYVHYFFVPYRVLWLEWEDFITGGPDGTEEPVLPTVTYNEALHSSYAKGTLADYLGVPVTDETITQDLTISALPFHAYYQICNDYYRDLNIMGELTYDRSSGPRSLPYPATVNRCLEHDYFTSCMPWAQRGDAVEYELDVFGTGVVSQQHLRMVESGGGQPDVGDTRFDGTTESFRDASSQQLWFSSDQQSLFANLEIAELRQAERLQQWLERNARGGARYQEQMLSHFGVVSDDARLNRAEYLGGGKSPVNISEVTQMSQSDTTPQGTLAGKGISMSKTNRFQRTFKEHGIVMGILSVLPRTAYQEGFERFWTKTDKTEFFWPSFANLGEQEVLQKEIYWDPTGTDMDDTFGYQSRYAEYKWKKSSVHGDFLDDFDYWHMGRVLGSAPTLGGAFIQCESSDYDRVFAVETEAVHKLYAQVYNDVQAIRPIPQYSIPGL